MPSGGNSVLSERVVLLAPTQPVDQAFQPKQQESVASARVACVQGLLLGRRAQPTDVNLTRTCKLDFRKQVLTRYINANL